MGPDYEIDAIIEAVGRITAGGAGLEWALADVHEALLHSPRGHVVVAGEGFDQARRGCLELAEHLGEPVLSMVKGVISQAAAVWAERNDVVHGVWLAGLEGQPAATAMSLRMRRKTGREIRTWTLDELRALGQRVIAASDAAVNLDMELRSKAVVARLGGRPSFEI